MIYDNKTIEMDNITLEDCEDLFHKKNMVVEINDGRIVKITKE